jgi:hypothetical protein
VAILAVALASALSLGVVGPLIPGLAGSALAVDAPTGDGAVEIAGLFHDSRDDLYRSPGGAVPAGTAVTLRARTLHGDATARSSPRPPTTGTTRATTSRSIRASGRRSTGTDWSPTPMRRGCGSSSTACSTT